MIASRFDSPSVSLGLTDLLRRTRKVLGVAALVAILGHMSLVHLRLSQAEQKAAKPLTTQFIKRQPRLSKPLELKKRPRPKQRRTQRQMLAAKARVRSEGSARAAGIMRAVSHLVRPIAHVRRSASFETASVEPKEMSQAIEGTKDPQSRIDTGLEMVDIQALDTGEYRAMVIQDPSDKRNVKGFFHMARLRSAAIDFIPTAVSILWTEWIKNNSMVRIARALNRYTGIRTDYRDNLTPDDREIFKVPLVFLMPSWSFQLTESESRNVGLYLISGGLLFCDGWDLRRVKSLDEAVEGALAAQGISDAEWEAETLPNDHPLYHCFFDFDGAPPGGREFFNKPYYNSNDPNLQDPVIRGVSLHGRLVAIISEKYYTIAWGAFGLVPSPRWTALPFEDLDPTRSLQFAVNLVVFALTQEGSITHRLMESVQ